MRFFNLRPVYLAIYRTVGFVALLTITAALLIYCALMIFFFFNASWVAPTVLTPTSDRMLTFQQGYLTAKQTAEVDRLTYEQSMRETEVAQQNVKNLAQLSATFLNVGHDFQTHRNQKREDLKHSIKLAADLNVTLRSTAADLRDGLITNQEATTAIVESQQFENGNTDGALALDLGGIQYNVQVTALMAQLAQAKSDVQTKRSAAIAAGKAWQDAQHGVEVLEETSYFRAMNTGANLAFVPYDNFRSVKVGASVYDCYLMIVACHKVGTIRHVYKDEQVVDFPVFNVRLNRTVRGVMLDLDMTHSEYMSSTVFFIGKPLLF